MFGFFKRRPSAETVMANVATRLSESSRLIAVASQRFCDDLNTVYPEGDLELHLQMSVAFTQRIAERIWGKAAPVALVALDELISGVLEDVGDDLPDFKPSVARIRRSTDHLLDALLDSDFNVGAITGFADLLSESLAASYMRGLRVVNAVDMAKAISKLEASIASAARPSL